MIDATKKIILVLVIVTTHAVALIGGVFIARREALKSWAADNPTTPDMETTLEYYIHNRDIAVDIKDGDIHRAKCNIQSMVSTLFDDVKGYTSNKNFIGSRIQRYALKDAPEILGNAPIPFDYVIIEKRIKSCE